MSAQRRGISLARSAFQAAGKRQYFARGTRLGPLAEVTSILPSPCKHATYGVGEHARLAVRAISAKSMPRPGTSRTTVVGLLTVSPCPGADNPPKRPPPL